MGTSTALVHCRMGVHQRIFYADCTRHDTVRDICQHCSILPEIDGIHCPRSNGSIRTNVAKQPNRRNHACGDAISRDDGLSSHSEAEACNHSTPKFQTSCACNKENGQTPEGCV